MLHVFPDTSIDSSLHTAILVGLWVSWLLHERLGWVFAGFVVAGYLAAVAIVSPPTLLVLLGESILTYGVVRVLTDGLPAFGAWAPVFGRERFLLFVLVALPVRLLCSGVVVPRLGRWLAEQALVDGLAAPAVHGIGLVLVPLVANTFYKPGLPRGLAQVGAITTLTWLVLAQGLGSCTNLGFSAFAETLDALSVGPLPPARAMLLLLVTTFVAAHNNARFGWDFGGVLVPALLAMLALEPARLATTVLEVVVLYAAWRALLRVPWVGGLDLGGPRRIVAVYTLSWALHQGVAWVAVWWEAPLLVEDLFGFGYLLTSLVVTRCHVGGGVLRTIVPLVATAVEGMVIAAGVAALLVWGRPVEPMPAVALDMGAGRGGVLVQLAGSAEPWRPLAEPGSGEAWAADDGPRGVEACEVGETRAARVLTCHGDGPVLVLPHPLQDPDSGWLAAWVADRVDPQAVVVAAVDPPGGAASTITAVLRDARRIAGARDVVVVGTGAPALRVHGEGAAASLLQHLPGVAVQVDDPPDRWSPVWTRLGPGESLLLLSPEVVRHDATRTARPGDLLRAATTVVHALMRGGGDLARQEGALAWLGDLAGTRIEQQRRGGRVELILTLEDTRGRDRLVVRPDGAPWVVMTEIGQRWPGVEEVARHVAEVMDARLVWVSAPRDPSERRLSRLEGDSPLGRLARALLDAGHEVSVVQIGALPAEHGRVEVEVSPHVDPGVLTSALAPWPGRTVGPLASSRWAAPMPEAARRQLALGRGLVVMRLSGAALREAWPDPRFGAWSAAWGLRLTEPTWPDGRPVDHPVRRLLQAHADAPSEASARALRGLAGAEVQLGRQGPRWVVSARVDGVTCAAVAGASEAEAWPWSGCRAAP